MSSARLKDIRAFAGFGPMAIACVIFLYAPILFLAVYSFNDGRSVSQWSGFSFRWYAKVMENGDIQAAALNSLIIAAIAASVATLLALGAALAMANSRFRGEAAAYATLTLPLMVPEIVTAVASMIFFVAIGISLGFTTILLAHIVFCIPFAYLPIRARLEGLDQTLRAAAADLYASRWRLAHVDRFSDDGPDRALRPMSLRNIQAELRQFLDALVETGADPEDLTSLAIVVTADNMKRAFGHLVRRNGGEIPVGLQNKASVLLAIALHHLKLPPKEIEPIQAIKRKALKPYDGMTPKNRARLAQIDTPRSRAVLYNLPFALMKRAKSNSTSPRSRLAAMWAVAMAILMAAPIRIKNLAALDVDRHLRVEGTSKHRRYSIWIQGSEVKNGVPLELDLGSEVSVLLAEYLDGFRHLRGAPAGTALFPNGSGASRSACELGRQISTTIHRETGLEVNPHLFRHLAAKLYLERYPGDYETVRRLLGHKKLDTTLTAYASFDNRRAQGHYHEAVLTARKPRARR